MIIPPGNREARLNPALEIWPHLVEANRRLPLAPMLEDLRAQARREFADLTGLSPSQPLVMTGHQPEFVHPGVWMRFLLLDLLRQRWGLEGAAFAVDSDLADEPAVEVPFLCRGELLRRRVELATEGGATYESLLSPSAEAWRRFCKVIEEALACPAGARARLAFRRVGSFIPPAGSFPAFSVALRRFWEGTPSYPEIHLSVITRIPSFGRFFLLLAEQALSFAVTLNTALAGWRVRHRARSTAVPFPDLEIGPGRVELPFWWEKEGRRSPLFLKEGQLWIQDQPLGTIKEALAAAAIRPRAVSLTLFMRLCLADLFLHGAGGADYEEVTDEVILRFFHATPPAFVSATLTLFLPGEEPSAGSLKRLLRDLEQRPERYLANSQRAALIAVITQKSATMSSGKLDRTGYRALQAANEGLRRPLRGQITALEKRVADAESARDVLSFRGYPFFFFQTEELRELLAAL
ncbi:MAG: hypothetical protein NTV33_04870 [Coprothermobacterota bacterium]|nr:hypothetical protein [Coprothermobacterota bacterium]